MPPCVHHCTPLLPHLSVVPLPCLVIEGLSNYKRERERERGKEGGREREREGGREREREREGGREGERKRK